MGFENTSVCLILLIYNGTLDVCCIKEYLFIYFFTGCSVAYLAYVFLIVYCLYIQNVADGSDIGELVYREQHPFHQESSVDNERMRPGHWWVSALSSIMLILTG